MATVNHWQPATPQRCYQVGFYCVAECQDPANKVDTGSLNCTSVLEACAARTHECVHHGHGIHVRTALLHDPEPAVLVPTSRRNIRPRRICPPRCRRRLRSGSVMPLGRCAGSLRRSCLQCASAKGNMCLDALGCNHDAWQLQQRDNTPALWSRLQPAKIDVKPDLMSRWGFR